MRRSPADWNAIKAAYMAAGPTSLRIADGFDQFQAPRFTLAGLARQFGVSYGALRRRARRERWAEEREAFDVRRGLEDAESRLQHQNRCTLIASKKFLGLFWEGRPTRASLQDLAAAARALGEHAFAVSSEALRLGSLRRRLEELENGATSAPVFGIGG